MNKQELKKEARELVEKYYHLNNGELKWTTDIPIQVAKECALIYIDNTIKILVNINKIVTNGIEGVAVFKILQHYKSLKKEVEQLKV